MEIYVGNLPSQVDIDQIAALFQQFGKVTKVRIVTDKFSGLSRGFGFVIMPEDHEAASAITSLAGKDFLGSKLDVREALTQSRIKSYEE